MNKIISFIVSILSWEETKEEFTNLIYCDNNIDAFNKSIANNI
jgi:hypothetical protein